MFQALLGRRTGAQRRAGRGRGDAGWGEWVGGTLPDSVCPMTVAVARMLLGASDGVDPQLPPDVTAIVEHTAIVKAMLVDCENHRLELFGSLRAAERGWLQRNSAVTEVMSVLVATDKNSEVSHGFLEHYSAVYHQLLNQLTEPAPGNTSCEQFLDKMNSGKLDYRRPRSVDDLPEARP